MKKNKLVRNQAKATAPKAVDTVQRFTVNLMPHQCRLENLEGRPHVVVPMVILTEGVHNGSNGPLYYGPEEMAKTPEAWNHKPIVIYHPEEGSACEKEVINERKCGIMLNTKFDPSFNRLKSEAWIEQDRADTIDERVMEAVHSHEMMEVSTGVYVDNEVTPGEWSGEDYVGIARNFRPDHLAILPDQIGACSIADGAGLLRNAAKKDPSGKSIKKVLALMKELGLTCNELSFDSIRNDLSTALREKLAIKENGPWVWIVDVFSNFFIYEFDSKLFRLGYTSTKTGVTLDNEAPAEVKRDIKYRTVETAKLIGNQDQPRKATTMTAKEKKTKIDALIANKDSGWSEDQRPVLEAMKDPQLEAQAKAFTPKKDEPKLEETTNNAEGDEDDEEDDEDEAPVVKNKGKKPAAAAAAPVKNNAAPKFDYKEWLKTAPGEVQEMVQNGVGVLNEEKQKLITEITSNENNQFSAEELGNKTLPFLRGIVALARGKSQASEDPTQHAFYNGMAPTATHNAGHGGGPTITPLALPTMNFEAEKASK